MHRRLILIALAGVAVVAYNVGEDDLLPYIDTIRKKADEHGISAALIAAIIKRESNFNPHAVGHNTNGTTDYGLMQINSNTFADVGISLDDVFDPVRNIDAGAKLIKSYRKYLVDAGKYSERALVSAYNEGIGNVVRKGIFNLAYVAYVLYWYTIYKVKGV